MAHSKEEVKKLMDTVYACLEACNHCFEACLREEEIDMVRGCIRLDRQCAEACLTVLAYAGRPEALTPELLEYCAKVCEECGNECARHEHMAHCRQCAAACEQCKSACKEYIQA